jgi:hypothetical protein
MHGGRVGYYVVGDDSNVISDAPAPPGGAAGASVPALRFGRLFGRTQHWQRPDERDRVVRKLVRLGQLMNEPAEEKRKGDSDIPSGYTYLGQFIAHEVTHDSTGNLLAANLKPENLSTPEIDLDSLYGGEGGPKSHPELYVRADGATLVTDTTEYDGEYPPRFDNDLPRGTKDSPDGKKKGNPNEPLLGDPRNAENLTLAQTHVAFIYFHNRVVDDLKQKGLPEEMLKQEGTPEEKLFAAARAEVIRHYQWIILYDFLPRLVRADVLDCVMRHGLRWFRGDQGNELFMPLEFSAAAFRIGHTMVRDSYEWNPLRGTGGDIAGPPKLTNLFEQTGLLEGGHRRLKSQWVIDWRHFYDFGPLNRYRPVGRRNMSARLDTVFDMHLDQVTGAPDEKLEQIQKAITVRNLLRGFYLGLPTGEEAAEWMGETPLTRKQVSEGAHEALLDDPAFWGKTPLWYYILREAEVLGFNRAGVPGNRLGPVGSRIVAETLIGLIEHSRYSIMREKDWRPAYARPSNCQEGRPKFEMIDLLHAAAVVSPVAKKRGQLVVD